MAEYAPEGLIRLAEEIRSTIPTATPSAIVDDGSHTSGYHRCRHVLPGHDYSVRIAADQEGDGWAVAALDVTFDPAWMVTVTRRLMDAALDTEDTRLDCLREFFGTLDGNTVTGWDCHYDKQSVGDSSHLRHVHLSVLRKYVDSRTRLANVLSVIAADGIMDLSDRAAVSERIAHRWSTTVNRSRRGWLGYFFRREREPAGFIADEMARLLAGQRTVVAAAQGRADEHRVVSGITEQLTPAVTDALWFHDTNVDPARLRGDIAIAVGDVIAELRG